MTNVQPSTAFDFDVRALALANMPPLKDLAGQWVKLKAASIYSGKEQQVLKAETKKPAGDGHLGTTPLVWRKLPGLKVEFTAESLMAYIALARKRGGFGRGESADGKVYYTTAIKKEHVQAINDYLKQNYSVELVDPTKKQKEQKARRIAKLEAEKAAAAAAANAVPQVN